MDKQLFIFDLDGTLVDAYAAIIASFNFTMRRMGYPSRTSRVIRRAVGWGDASLLAPFVGAKDLSRALKIYRQHHAGSLLNKVRFLPYARQLLVCLKNKGFKIAIASNRPTRFTRIILEALKVRGAFDRVLCADRLAFGKPNPLILNKLIKSFKVRKDRVLYVGDMALDVQTGRRAHVATAAVATGSSSLRELKKAGPTYLFKDLRTLKAACQKG